MSEGLNFFDGHELPHGWIELDLSVLRRTRSVTFNPEKEPTKTLELYSVPSHETGNPEIVKASDIGSNKQYVEPGDVLISKINPRINRAWVVGDFTEYNKIASTEWIVFAKNPLIESKLLQHILTDVRIRDYLAHNVSGVGGSLMRVKPSLMDSISIGLPPEKEQRRIVAKIEELFSELDKGIESLKTARKELNVYRQAILKHAFEGKLTTDWREENRDKLETTNQLLARIKQEREVRYEQQLEEWKETVKAWKAKGKLGKKPGKPKLPDNIESLNKDDLAELARLPNGWAWLKVGNLCGVVRGGSPRPAGDKKYYDGDIPFLKVADLTRNPGAYLDTFSYTIKEAGLQKTRLVSPNTLMISNSGATLGIPKICLIDATFNDGIAAFLGLQDHELLYHYYFWLSRTASLRGINQGAAQPNLNTDLLKHTFIPVCSSSEMQMVAQQIEKVLSVYDKLSREVGDAINRCEALRQSILKMAFSGQLVARDPNDEPASVLLDRVKAEKAMQERDNKKNKRRDAA